MEDILNGRNKTLPESIKILEKRGVTNDKGLAENFEIILLIISNQIVEKNKTGIEQNENY